MNLNIDYKDAIDFEHCENLNDATSRLSKLTNLLNKVIIARQETKKDILELFLKYPGEPLHKLSWENKLVRISQLTNSSKLTNLWQEADTAYRQIKAKQEQVYEEINVLKKMIDFTPA